jgi:hypothetical protein
MSYDALARELEALESVVVWEGEGRSIVVINYLAQIYDGMLNPFVLAKLPVRRSEIRKIDAAELLALGAKRLRIVHCSVNEVIEIDVLDLEGLDHMSAAGLEEFRPLLLIPITTKLCLYGMRRYGHLAERQCGSKNFDEKRFHRSAGF